MSRQKLPAGEAKVQFNTRLPQHMITELQALAKKSQKPVSALVIEAVRLLLDVGNYVAVPLAPGDRSVLIRPGTTSAQLDRATRILKLQEEE